MVSDQDQQRSAIQYWLLFLMLGLLDTGTLREIGKVPKQECPLFYKNDSTIIRITGKILIHAQDP